MALPRITEYSKVVDAPVGEIWAILAAFGCEKLWMPDCIQVSLQGIGIGAVRTLKFGATPEVEIVERLEAADPEKHTIRFKVTRSDLEGVEAYGNAALDVISADKTRFTWFAETVIDDGPAKEALKNRIDIMYAGFVESIASKLSKTT